MDEKITVLSLKKQVSTFRDDRDWLKDDTPRSLAISITVEAAELLEHFQWKNDDQMRESLLSPTTMNAVSDELADVMIYCLGFSDVLGIDLSEAIQRKLAINGEKYPVIRPKVSSWKERNWETYRLANFATTSSIPSTAGLFTTQ